MAESVLSLKEVAVYQQDNMVLNDISLEVRPGEFVYLIGKTGSGKSSFMKTLYADLPLRQGQGRIVGFNLKMLPEKDIPKLRRKLGIVFQDFKLLHRRTVEDNVGVALDVMGVPPRERKARVFAMLKRVGLHHRRQLHPLTLSGGEQQRLALARALVNDPEASDIDFISGSEAAPMVFDVPIVKPPLGRITAIDMNSGEHVWMMANGDTPTAYTDNPAFEGVDLPRTGKPTRAGIVVTKTLLFAGEGWGTVGGIRGDPVFRAHDKLTGEILAEIELPATQSGPPSTYMVDGRQYIAMMVTDGESPTELVALALPVASLNQETQGDDHE